MIEILQEPFEKYLTEKKSPFKSNELANKFRHDFPEVVSSIIPDKERYNVEGSAGKGQWTDCPWIAVLDILITNSPQSGYYPVFLFKSDMSGVYLSLNQGVTLVKQDYKRDAKNVLRLRAEDYRAKLEVAEDTLLTEIDLISSSDNAKLYQAGNILAKYYHSDNLPSEIILRNDLRYFLNLYEELTYFDNSLLDTEEGFEKKQIRFHRRIERNATLSKKVKKIKGYKCEACEMKFTEKYGDLGQDFIEAHHLTPISQLDIGSFKVNLIDDFAVLCSNCHSMIHRLEDPSDLNRLKEVIRLESRSIKS